MDKKKERLALIDKLEKLKAYRNKNGRHFSVEQSRTMAKTIIALEERLSALEAREDPLPVRPRGI